MNKPIAKTFSYELSDGHNTREYQTGGTDSHTLGHIDDLGNGYWDVWIYDYQSGRSHTYNNRTADKAFAIMANHLNRMGYQMPTENNSTQQRVSDIMELTEAIHARVGMLTIVKEIEVDPYPQGVMVTVETTNGQTIKMPLQWDIRHGDAIYMLRNSAKIAYGLNA